LLDAAAAAAAAERLLLIAVVLLMVLVAVGQHVFFLQQSRRAPAHLRPPKRKPKTPKTEPNSTMASGPITVTLSESKREEFAELQVLFSSFLTSLSCSFRSLIPSDAFLGPIHAHSPAVGAREPRIFKTLFSFRLFCIRYE
jgi:hypothetical protein